MCQDCRAELPVGILNRGLVFLCGLVLLGIIAGCGFGLVFLIQWLYRAFVSTP